MKVNEIAAGFPAPDSETAQRLSESMGRLGLLRPITLVRHKGTVTLLDGRARLRICENEGIAPRFDVIDIDTPRDVLQSLIALNEHRLDYHSEGPLALYAAELCLKGLFLASEIAWLISVRRVHFGVRDLIAETIALLSSDGAPEIKEALRAGEIGAKEACDIRKRPKSLQLSALDYRLAGGAKPLPEYISEFLRGGRVKAYEADWHTEIHKRAVKYGLTGTDIERMLSEQGGACAICETEFTDDLSYVIEHCHACGGRSPNRNPKSVRGLVCHSCNSMLRYRDTLAEEMFFRGGAYILEHRKVCEGANEEVSL